MTQTFPKIIKTERLLLRPYRWDDINDLLNFSVEERWSRYIRAPYPYTQKDAQEFLADRVGLSRPDQDVWCLEIENRVVGDAGFGWHKKNSAAEATACAADCETGAQDKKNKTQKKVSVSVHVR